MAVTFSTQPTAGIKAACGSSFTHRDKGIKAGRKGSAGELKIEVFPSVEKGFFVTIFDTKSAEVV